jgi:hypothetical protein
MRKISNRLKAICYLTVSYKENPEMMRHFMEIYESVSLSEIEKVKAEESDSPGYKYAWSWLQKFDVYNREKMEAARKEVGI